MGVPNSCARFEREGRLPLYQSRRHRNSVPFHCQTASASAIRVMHGVFPGRESALAAVLGEVGFRALREVVFPRGFEAGPRLIEASRVAGAGLAAVR
jgi:hypothetical protein